MCYRSTARTREEIGKNLESEGPHSLHSINAFEVFGNAIESACEFLVISDI